MKERRPLNKQVIVIYSSGAESRMFHNYVSTVDIREACTRQNCGNEDEHYTFDGQFFFKVKQNVRKRK